MKTLIESLRDISIPGFFLLVAILSAVVTFGGYLFYRIMAPHALYRADLPSTIAVYVVTFLFMFVVCLVWINNL